MAKTPAGLLDQIQLIFGDLVDLNRRDLVGTGLPDSIFGHEPISPRKIHVNGCPLRMLNISKRREHFGQVTLDSKSESDVNFSPCHEESVCGILQDIRIRSVTSEAIPDVSLSHVYRFGIHATVPDDVHASKAIEVRMSQVYCEKRAPCLPFALGPVQPIHRCSSCKGYHSILGMLTPHGVEGPKITPTSQRPGAQPPPARYGSPARRRVGSHARAGRASPASGGWRGRSRARPSRR